jgi:hypothetical protein
MASKPTPLFQTALPFDSLTWHAAAAVGSEERGAIFTRPEVVAFILDLVGYTSDQPLTELRLLEPAFGQGDFLFPALDRLLTVWSMLPAESRSVADLLPAIRAVELHEDSFHRTRQQLLTYLQNHGFSSRDATTLADAWLIRGDFLLTDLSMPFHVVVGNPPYVRQERIPDALMAEYRARFSTIYDRADLYIPFIEKSLTLLEPSGHLGFICADRWMKNRYGGPLRRLVADHYHLKVYVDMVDTPAFQTEVIAYPAITIIARQRGHDTCIVQRPAIDPATLTDLARQITGSAPPDPTLVRRINGVAIGAEPWILDAADQVALVRRLEASFPTLEEAGCSIGIGVATGADAAFIGAYTALDVEPDRKLPLATTRDIQGGTVVWRGLGVINPFADDGSLVDLDHYPRLRAYLEARRDQIAGRHVAKKTPAAWYRTIDRITPALAQRPKLLIPDIKGTAHIVYEEGQLYPHHNLYYIVSDTWDLRALQTVLRSGIAHLFVTTYSTQMRGGFLRFQAQYLRRIRLPRWADVPEGLRAALITAGVHDDRHAGHQAVAALYAFSPAECATLGMVHPEE